MNETFSKKEYINHLGESIHCAFRKASHHANTSEIWRLITELPDDDWSGILEFIYTCIDGISIAKESGK